VTVYGKDGRTRAVLLPPAIWREVVGLSPHRLRHAHASHSLDAGAPIHVAQATLGHASVSTTSRYLHARPGTPSAPYL
jgi:integrase/recombinase XerD